MLTVFPTTVTTNSFEAEWTPECDDFEEYLLRIIDTDEGGSTGAEIRRDTAPDNGDRQLIDNLIPGTLYRLELYTVQDDGELQLSDVKEVITGTYLCPSMI